MDLCQRLYDSCPKKQLLLRLHACILTVKMDIQNRFLGQHPALNSDPFRKYTLIIDRIRLLLHSFQHISNGFLYRNIFYLITLLHQIRSLCIHIINECAALSRTGTLASPASADEQQTHDQTHAPRRQAISPIKNTSHLPSPSPVKFPL